MNYKNIHDERFAVINISTLNKLLADQVLRNDLLSMAQMELPRDDWKSAFDYGAKIEPVSGLGKSAAGGSDESMREIALKLQRGNAVKLLDFALELQKVNQAEQIGTGEAQQGNTGYGARYPNPGKQDDSTHPAPRIVNAQPLKLKNGDAVTSAFKHIAWECLYHLQGNQNMVLYGTDVEGVHQMRVALRRLRTAFKLFRKALGHEGGALLLAEFGLIEDALRQARDLDVFLTQMLMPVMAQFERHAGLLALRDEALALQAESYAKLRAILSSQRYQGLLLTAATWLECHCCREDDSNEKHTKLRNIATSALTKHYKQLLASGKQLDYMHPEACHATRIATKKMRYVAEFFVSLYPAKKSRLFIRSSP